MLESVINGNQFVKATSMNRRDFIKLISTGVTAAFVLDPEQLLWVPGAKTIILPPERRLIYSSELHESDWNTFGVAVGDMDVINKFFYEYKEGQPYLNLNQIGRYRMKHVEIYEVIKGLHYHPEQ